MHNHINNDHFNSLETDKQVWAMSRFARIPINQVVFLVVWQEVLCMLPLLILDVRASIENAA